MSRIQTFIVLFLPCFFPRVLASVMRNGVWCSTLSRGCWWGPYMPHLQWGLGGASAGRYWRLIFKNCSKWSDWRAASFLWQIVLVSLPNHAVKHRIHVTVQFLKHFKSPVILLGSCLICMISAKGIGFKMHTPKGLELEGFTGIYEAYPCYCSVINLTICFLFWTLIR